MARSFSSSTGLRSLGVLILVLALAAGAWFAFDDGFRSQRSALMNDGPDGFGQQVRAYLLENPEVIMEALQSLEERRRTAELNGVHTVIQSRAEELLNDPASPVGGNPEGDVTLVEFFDYNCPYCRRVGPVMIEAEEGDPGLRIVYKEFPILGPNSTAAAKVALATHRQGRYAEFHKELMQAKGVADEASALRLAEELGLDMERLKEDMEAPEVQTAIDRNLALAQDLRISGTPTFIVGDQLLPGATDLGTLRALIGRARAGQSQEDGSG
jgi:protein-disulfide isomerase